MSLTTRTDVRPSDDHVTPIKLFHAAGLGVGDEVVHRVFLEAASLCTVTWSSDGRTSVRVVNDTSHLR